MEKRYIMTAFGKDRTGIIADISQIMFDLGCILEDSNMTRLADEFAAIFLLSSPQGDIEQELNTACRRLEIEKGLPAYFRPISAKQVYDKEPAPTHTLYIESFDQCGILYKVGSFLDQKNVNIVHLESHQRFTPQSGTPLYNIHIDIEVPETLSFEDLRQGLQDIGQELHVDIKLKEFEPHLT